MIDDSGGRTIILSTVAVSHGNRYLAELLAVRGRWTQVAKQSYLRSSQTLCTQRIGGGVAHFFVGQLESSYPALLQ